MEILKEPPIDLINEVEQPRLEGESRKIILKKHKNTAQEDEFKEKEIEKLKKINPQTEKILAICNHVVLKQQDNFKNKWDICNVSGALYLVMEEYTTQILTKKLKKRKYKIILLNLQNRYNYFEEVDAKFDANFIREDQIICYRDSNRIKKGFYCSNMQELEKFYESIIDVVNKLNIN